VWELRPLLTVSATSRCSRTSAVSDNLFMGISC
jgi:hypothetical protein